MQKVTLKLLATKCVVALFVTFIIVSSAKAFLSDEEYNAANRIASNIEKAGRRYDFSAANELFDQATARGLLIPSVVANYILAMGRVVHRSSDTRQKMDAVDGAKKALVIAEEKGLLKNKKSGRRIIEHYIRVAERDEPGWPDEVNRAYNIAKTNKLLNAHIVAHYICRVKNFKWIQDAFDVACKNKSYKLLNSKVIANYIVAVRNLKRNFDLAEKAFKIAEDSKLLNSDVIKEYLWAAEKAGRDDEVQRVRQTYQKQKKLDRSDDAQKIASPSEEVRKEAADEAKIIKTDLGGVPTEQGEDSYEVNPIDEQDELQLIEQQTKQEVAQADRASHLFQPPTGGVTRIKAVPPATRPAHPAVNPSITISSQYEQNAKRAVVGFGRFTASEKFFNPEKCSPIVIELINRFKAQYEDAARNTQELDITGLGSRMRIMLINRIVNAKKQKFNQIDQHFWKKINHTKQKVFYRDKKPTVFRIGDFKYELVCYVTKNQTGGGEIRIVTKDQAAITGIGNIKSYERLIEYIKDLKEEKGGISKYIRLLLIQRKYGDPINTGEPQLSCILNYLNLLLDYEEARRRVDGDLWRTLPIAPHINHLLQELEYWDLDTDRGRNLLSLFMSAKYRYSAERLFAEFNNTAKATEIEIREDQLASLHGPDEYSDDEYLGTIADKELKRVKREQDFFAASIVDRYIQGIRSANRHRLVSGDDLEFEIIAELYHRRVVIYYQDENDGDAKISHREFGQLYTAEPITLWFDGKYYFAAHPIIASPKDLSELSIEASAGDENCLYRAVFNALGPKGKSVARDINELRHRVAAELEKHPEKIPAIPGTDPILENLSVTLKKPAHVTAALALGMDHPSQTVQNALAQLKFLAENIAHIITNEEKQKNILNNIKEAENLLSNYKEINTTEDSLAITNMVNDIVLLCWASMEFEVFDEPDEIVDFDSPYSTDGEIKEPRRVSTAGRAGASSFVAKGDILALDLGVVPAISKFHKEIGNLRKVIQQQLDKGHDSQRAPIARTKPPKRGKPHGIGGNFKKNRTDSSVYQGTTYQQTLQGLIDKILKSWYDSKKPVTGVLGGDREWYTDNIIYDLLQHYLPEEEGRFIIIPPAVAIFDNIELLNDAIRVAMQGALNNRVVVMPMHLHGNHWVGAVFRRRTTNGAIQVIYINPQGTRIDAETNVVPFVTAIQQYQGGLPPSILDLNLIQQRNDYDCGPFTVDNLVRLARFVQGHAAELGRLREDQVRDYIIAQAGIQQPATGDAADIRREHNIFLERQPQPQPQPGGVLPQQVTLIRSGQNATTSAAPFIGSSRLVGSTKLAINEKVNIITDEMSKLTISDGNIHEGAPALNTSQQQMGLDAGLNTHHQAAVLASNQTVVGPAVLLDIGSGLKEYARSQSGGQLENITNGISQMTITTDNTQRATILNILPAPLGSITAVLPLPLSQTRMPEEPLHHDAPTTTRGGLTAVPKKAIPGLENLRRTISQDFEQLCSTIDCLAPSSTKRTPEAHRRVLQVRDNIRTVVDIVRNQIQSAGKDDIENIEASLRKAIDALKNAAQCITSRLGDTAIHSNAKVASDNLELCRCYLIKLGWMTNGTFWHVIAWLPYI